MVLVQVNSRQGWDFVQLPVPASLEMTLSEIDDIVRTEVGPHFGLRIPFSKSSWIFAGKLYSNSTKLKDIPYFELGRCHLTMTAEK